MAMAAAHVGFLKGKRHLQAAVKNDAGVQSPSSALPAFIH